MSIPLNQQRTLMRPTTIEGTGLHLGRSVRMTLKPSRAFDGIVFRRIDLSGKPTIPALAEFIVDTTRSCTIAWDGVIVQAVEHVLSALWGMGIDNCLIELSSLEPPALDGSMLEFAKMILQNGIKLLDEERKYYRVPEHGGLYVQDGESHVEVSPARETTYSYELEYPAPVGKQWFSVKDDHLAYARELSGARTFASAEDVAWQKRNGLSKGVAKTEALIYAQGAWLGEPKLRFGDEPCRHKVADLIGDMALAGIRVKGHIQSHLGGHTLHVTLAKRVRDHYLSSIKQAA